VFAHVLFNLALFFTLLIGFMYKNFVKIKFFISWWAFVFPLAAMAIAAMRMYASTHDAALLFLSYGLICVTTVVICIVIYQTLIHMQKREICIQE
jgi:tellurite resistance protein